MYFSYLKCRLGNLKNYCGVINQTFSCLLVFLPVYLLEKLFLSGCLFVYFTLFLCVYCSAPSGSLSLFRRKCPKHDWENNYVNLISSGFLFFYFVLFDILFGCEAPLRTRFFLHAVS